MASSTVTTKQGEALESAANTSSAVATAQAQPLAAGPEVSRRELDDVRSMRQATTSLTDSLANDHHRVAHTDFQQTVTANITKNQKSLDDARPPPQP